ncbi:MAG: hypothetical protein K0R59_209 [Sphingobacterium sp.]|jgi:hypothetical protein|nr:hypothetical protein [Sphingobacterium sp.]
MKIKNLSYLLLSSVLLTSGCNKYLDKEPDMRAELNTMDKIKRMITSSYPGYNYLAMAEYYSDNVEDKGVGDREEPVSTLYAWKDVIDDSDDTPTGYWKSCYSAIAAANHALDAIAKNDFGDEILPYKGEALVARAYAHFMLVSFFSKPYEIGKDNSSPGIPYVTDPETVVIKKYERGTVKSVYDNIQKDLEEGLALLNTRKGEWAVPKYHFTPAAAHAFAARYYLFCGQWQKVVDNANGIFSNGDFTGKLIPWSSTFKSQEAETVRTNFAKAEQPYNLLINETNSTYARWGKNNYGMGVGVFQEIYNGKTVAGKQFYNKGLSFTVPHYTTYLWKEFFYQTNAASATGYPMLMVPIFISDEALLNRAEAYVELGNTAAALSDINLFAANRIENYNANTHAVTVAKAKAFFNSSDEKEALIQTVLQFKQIGFMSMGLRWFDVVRKKITVKHNFIDKSGAETIIELKPEDPRRIFQIPQEAKLSGLELNPR